METCMFCAFMFKFSMKAKKTCFHVFSSLNASLHHNDNGSNISLHISITLLCSKRSISEEGGPETECVVVSIYSCRIYTVH